MSFARRLVAPEPGWVAEADVIVVGSGVAGLTAALELRTRVKRVLIVTKGILSSGSTIWAQGGIAAALDVTDTPEAHLTDTLEAGGGLCSVPAVDVLVREGPGRVRELMKGGARFDLATNGDVSLTREGGHHANRIVHAGGDATGAEVSRALIAQLEAVRNDPGIEVVEHALVVDLLTAEPDADGRPGPVCGVTLHVIGEGTRDGIGASTAKAVIVATGGIGQVYRSSTNPPSATADGIAMALRAGATVADLEFVQFHPTVLWLGTGARGQLPLISEAVRGEGALLINSEGKRFMPDVHPMAELAPRDVVSHAIVEQIQATGEENVYLDARHLGSEFAWRRFPTIQEALAEHGLDLATDLIPVAPAQHFHSGGILTDLYGRSDLEGLYAAGEAACTGVHGANRLASNSLLEGLVYAHRAAHDAAARVSSGELIDRDPVRRKGTQGLLPATDRQRIQRIAHQGVGPVRDGAGLEEAWQELREIRRPGRFADSPVEVSPQTAEWETTNIAQTTAGIISAAQVREESRGGHFRLDYPQPSNEWKVRLSVSFDGADELKVAPIPLERLEA
ncbi:MAG: L-aspartate oxidase [Demequinaceae bacterium]|nr:L-aspartate oxidase [Demequinaceae bacterium]